MDLVDIIESKRFLGHEFLSWLWYQTEVHEGRFDLGDEGQATVAFDDQLVLEAFLAESEQSRLTGSAPAQSPEARSARRAGKHVSKAKLKVVRGEREWVFSVNARDFHFSSVRVPAVLKGDDERLLERLNLVDELSDIWRALYRSFLDVRLSDDWPRTRSAMQSWAQAED
jgi:hypothetical protein